MLGIGAFAVIWLIFLDVVDLCAFLSFFIWMSLLSDSLFGWASTSKYSCWLHGSTQLEETNKT